MAVIDFKCEACGKEFFEVTTWKDRKNVRCPECGSSSIKQVFQGRAYLKSGEKAGCVSRSCRGCSGCG